MTDRQVSQRPTVQPHEHSDDAGIRRRAERRATSPSWLARAAGVGLSIVSVGFALVFLFILESGGELTLITRPRPMQFALALPYLIVILTLGTVLGAVLAWWNRYWSLPARIHQTILALLGLGFTWQLASLGFLAL